MRSLLQHAIRSGLVSDCHTLPYSPTLLLQRAAESKERAQAFFAERLRVNPSLAGGGVWPQEKIEEKVKAICQNKNLFPGMPGLTISELMRRQKGLVYICEHAFHQCVDFAEEVLNLKAVSLPSISCVVGLPSLRLPPSLLFVGCWLPLHPLLSSSQCLMLYVALAGYSTRDPRDEGHRYLVQPPPINRPVLRFVNEGDGQGEGYEDYGEEDEATPPLPLVQDLGKILSREDAERLGFTISTVPLCESDLMQNATQVEKALHQALRGEHPLGIRCWRVDGAGAKGWGVGAVEGVLHYVSMTYLVLGQEDKIIWEDVGGNKRVSMIEVRGEVLKVCH
jgi:hypothetical protein